MSAEVESMAYAGEVPWHGLGTKVPADLTPAQIQKVAGLDWNVEKVDTYFNLHGEQVPSGKQVLIRSTDGRVLTHVSDTWNPVQNDEAFDFFGGFIEDGDMEMHTAGSLRDGQIIWALAKVKDGFTVFGKDRVDSYLLFSNPHQFGRTVEVRFTPIRVVCNNTLSLALSGSRDAAVRVNHRKEFDAAHVKQLLGLASTQMGQYKELAELLGTKRYTDESMVEYFKQVFPRNSDIKGKSEPSRAAERAMEIVDDQPGAEFAPGTYWNLFNAVSYLTDHELGRTADTRMQSAWFGGNARKKVDALHLAREMAEVS